MRTKDDIRRDVWDSLKENRVARFPGVEGRIPNFIGAEACATLLAGAPYWRTAKILKINPDSPQRAIRQRALAEGKLVYMAVPRLRSDNPSSSSILENLPVRHMPPHRSKARRSTAVP